MTNPTLSPKDVAELREFVVYIRNQNDLYIKHSGTAGKYLTVAEREKVDALLALASQSLERDGEIRSLPAIVQYRRKDGGHDWITMAAFDVASAAEKYCDQQSKTDGCPWEYRWLEMDNSHDTR